MALHAARALHEHFQSFDVEAKDPDRMATRRERIALLERGVAGESMVEEAECPPCPTLGAAKLP